MGGFMIRPCVLPKVLLLVSVIVCSIVAAKARASVVNIGALLSFDSAIGKVAKVAIQAAVEDVNRDQSLLPETRLHLTMQETNYSGFLGLVEGLILMERETVAIIGPEFSVTAHIISHVVKELRVPVLSYAATDPTLSSLQNPFFVRTTHGDLFQMAAISDLVEYYGWRDVIAIYADDEHGRNAIAALGDKLAEKRCRILYKAPLSSEVNQTDIANVLVKVAFMESRILVLVAYPGWGLELLHVAKYLGMMNAGYVWIVNDWLSTLLDTNSPLPSGVMDDMQGLLTLRMYTPDSEQKKKFASGWRKLIVEKGANGSFGLNTYGLCAYDTVWLLAHALDAFFNQGGNISFSHDPKLSNEIHRRGNLHPESMSIFDGGKLLLQSILQMNITGLTGPIKFDEDRNLVHPAYEVINVIGTGFRRVGFWSNYSGLSVVRPETLYATPPNRSSQQLYSVVWPGQAIQKPRGWVFPNDGRHLKIGVPNRVIFKEFESVESNDTFKGYCIDVFTAALNLLPYAVPYKFHAFGDGRTNPEKTELLELMAAGVYDAVVGDIAITTNRTRIGDFTQPYIESGLVVVAPVRKRNSSAWSFLRPFTPMMWCVTGLFFLFMGVVVWILEHRINDDFRGPPERQIVTMLWFSFSTLFFAHKKPLGGLGRLVLIVWLFVVFLLNSSYTASLTSILTVEQLSSTIKGIESLVSSNEPIGYQRGSFTESYLAEEYNIDRSRLIPLNSEEEYAKTLRDGPSRGGVAAVIDQRAYMELFLSTRCEFSIVGQEFSKIGWGFAFPRDSPLAVDMSTAILKLSENGDLERIHDKWLQRSACSSEGTKQEAERLQLKSFWGLFVLCTLACLLALLLHLIKIVQQFGKLYSEDIESSGRSSTVERLQTFLSFVDEKEEEAKSRSKRRKTERTSNRSIDGDESMTSSFKSTNSAGSSAV